MIEVVREVVNSHVRHHLSDLPITQPSAPRIRQLRVLLVPALTHYRPRQLHHRVQPRIPHHSRSEQPNLLHRQTERLPHRRVRRQAVPTRVRLRHRDGDRLPRLCVQLALAQRCPKPHQRTDHHRRVRHRLAHVGNHPERTLQRVQRHLGRTGRRSRIHKIQTVDDTLVSRLSSASKPRVVRPLPFKIDRSVDSNASQTKNVCPFTSPTTNSFTLNIPTTISPTSRIQPPSLHARAATTAPSTDANTHLAAPASPLVSSRNSPRSSPP